jgi:hypothetical protein
MSRRDFPGAFAGVMRSCQLDAGVRLGRLPLGTRCLCEEDKQDQCEKNCARNFDMATPSVRPVTDAS